MELHRYILEYILNEKCGGRKTYCASQLGIKYEEFRKAYQRIQKGHTSPLIMIGMLDYIRRKNIDLREIFAKYDASNMGQELESKEAACEEMHNMVISKISRCKRNALDFFAVFKSAEQFCQELKAHYCDEVCPCQQQVSSKCPLARLDHFIVELQEMSSHFSEEKADDDPKTDKVPT